MVAAYAAYRKYPRRTVHRRSTQASNVNDEIFAHVVSAFDGVPDTKPVADQLQHLRFLKIGDGILLWFKKLDRSRKLRVYPTTHAQRMEASGQHRLFPGCVLLVVGYLLSQDEKRVCRVSISKPAGHGAKPAWYIDFDINKATTIAQIAGGRQGDASPRRPRITIKQGARQIRMTDLS
ncbi:MAG TPA: hypothetical protein VN442_21900 [Bryobacteraceae bacterium]|nr:hypothetical protein [Bryobacteraceae bacterium]